MLTAIKRQVKSGKVAKMDIIPFSPARLERERKRQGLKQSELAAKAGLSQGAISQLEKGIINPREKQLRAIGRALGVKFLADWEDESWEAEAPYHLKSDKAP